MPKATQQGFKPRHRGLTPPGKVWLVTDDFLAIPGLSHLMGWEWPRGWR